MRTTTETGRTSPSPVDDVTYNLVQSLTSRLESIEALGIYAADGGEFAELFDRMAREDADAAAELLQALRRRLAG